MKTRRERGSLELYGLSKKKEGTFKLIEQTNRRVSCLFNRNRIEDGGRVVEGSSHRVTEGFGEMERRNESTREQYNKRCGGDRKGHVAGREVALRKKKGKTTGVRRGKQR